MTTDCNLVKQRAADAPTLMTVPHAQRLHPLAVTELAEVWAKFFIYLKNAVKYGLVPPKKNSDIMRCSKYHRIITM